MPHRIGFKMLFAHECGSDATNQINKWTTANKYLTLLDGLSGTKERENIETQIRHLAMSFLEFLNCNFNNNMFLFSAYEHFDVQRIFVLFLHTRQIKSVIHSQHFKCPDYVDGLYVLIFCQFCANKFTGIMNHHRLDINFELKFEEKKMCKHFQPNTVFFSLKIFPNEEPIIRRWKYLRRK